MKFMVNKKRAGMNPALRYCLMFVSICHLQPQQCSLQGSFGPGCINGFPRFFGAFQSCFCSYFCCFCPCYINFFRQFSTCRQDSYFFWLYINKATAYRDLLLALVSQQTKRPNLQPRNQGCMTRQDPDIPTCGASNDHVDVSRIDDFLRGKQYPAELF